jgi:polar amino acid transport system substrate-binding protein
MFHLERKTAKSFIYFWLMVILLIACSPRAAVGPEYSTDQPTVSTGREDTATSFARIHESGVLLVGTAITKPFEYHDPETGSLVGLDIDLVNYIAGTLDVKPEFVEMSFANLIPALQENKVDMAIAAMYITPEREDQVDFSMPYLYSGLVMVVQHDLFNEINSIEDLQRRKLGVKIGSTGAELAAELNTRGYQLIINEYKDTFDSFLDLEVSRVDVIFNDYLNSLVYIKNSDSSLKIALDESGEPIFLSNVGLGIAIRQGNQELLDVVNAALTDMNQSGTFQKISDNWLLPEVN